MISYLESAVSMPLLSLPVRTGLITTPTARILICPGSRLTDAQLAEAGAVTDIVANSKLHGAGMVRAAAAHPKARLWGVPGIRKKFPDLTWSILGEDAWPHEADIACLLIAGMPKMTEYVFVDRASKTLYVGDLVFNVREPKGAGSWIIYKLFGTYQRFAVSKFFVSRVDDKAAFTASMKQLVALDWDALAPAHGSVVESNAKQQFIAALAERGFTL